MHARTFTLAVALAGCGGVGVTQPAIVGGTADTSDPSVLFMLLDVGGQYESCTAEVISPHVVLTAAHCVLPHPGATGTASWSFWVGNVFTPGAIPPNALKAKEAHAHPQFVYASDAGQGIHDIAVAVLEQPSPVAPLPYAHASPAMSAPTRLVGFGLTDGTAMTGAGTKRQTTTALTDFTADYLHFADGQHQDCNGDSGGPAFQTVGGVETIVGVTSGPGMTGNTACTAGGVDTRVDTNADFVDQYVLANDPGFLAPADMASPLLTVDSGVALDLAAGNRNGNGGAGANGNSGGNGSGGGSGVGRSSGGCSFSGQWAAPPWALTLVLVWLRARRPRQKR